LRRVVGVPRDAISKAKQLCIGVGCTNVGAGSAASPQIFKARRVGHGAGAVGVGAYPLSTQGGPLSTLSTLSRLSFFLRKRIHELFYLKRVSVLVFVASEPSKAKIFEEQKQSIL